MGANLSIESLVGVCRTLQDIMYSTSTYTRLRARRNPGHTRGLIDGLINATHAPNFQGAQRSATCAEKDLFRCTSKRVPQGGAPLKCRHRQRHNYRVEVRSTQSLESANNPKKKNRQKKWLNGPTRPRGHPQDSSHQWQCQN